MRNFQGLGSSKRSKSKKAKRATRRSRRNNSLQQLEDRRLLAADVFINEFHYDNVSDDVGEFVEIAGPAGTDLTGWTLALYNGSDNELYNSNPIINLSGTIDDEGNGGGAVDFQLPANGLQNGSADGIALVDDLGTVIQFISYEGTLTASGGPADGMTSTDVGVSEPSNANIGESLQLTGGPGSQDVDFTWTGPVTASPGSLNAGQTYQASSSGSTISIIADDASKAEGDAGTTSYTFTVNRSGDSSGAVSVDWSVAAAGSLNAADFGGSLPSGTVSFADGDLAPKTVTINVSGDTDVEADELFDVVLANASGATINTGTAGGTIQDDDTPLPSVIINEFVANHTGSDTDEFIEVFGTANADLSQLTLLAIEGDGSGAGTIDEVISLASQSTDANGYYAAFLSEVLENGSQTFLLVSGFTGSDGDDLDTDNDGILDVTPWTSILDDVALSDDDAGDQYYSTSVIFPGQDGGTFTYGGASRIPNGVDTDSAADWRRNNFAGDGLPSFGDTFATAPGEAVNTPGAENFDVPATPGLIVTESNGTTEVSEAGQTDSFQIGLTTNPSSPVTVTVTPANSQIDLGAGPGVAVVLNFSDLLPQTVTVSAVDDAAIEGGHSAGISISTSSSDSDYNGLGGNVTASIADNDSMAPFTLINEFVANHSGTDTDAFVELLSSPNADLSSLSVVEVSGEGSFIGQIASVTPLTTADANGYLTVLQDFFNDSVTLLLVEGFSGTVGDDIDTDDDGVLDATPWTLVRDSVSVLDTGGYVYSETVLEAGFDGNTFIPGGASRIPNGTDTDTAADWVRNAFGGEGLPSFSPGTSVPGEAINTPGAPNQVSGGLNIVQSDGNTAVAEAGATDTIDFSLGTIPSSSVTVTVTPDAELDLGSGAGVAVQLTFLADASATTPQQIVVTAVDDTDLEGSHSGLISISFASADPNYNGTADDITVAIADDDLVSPSVVISEIMYNPATAESTPLPEWIEVVNVGPGSADISGWMFDDEDSSDWGAIPGGTILTEGQVVVFFDSAFTNAADFRADWNVPASALVIGIDWGSLANSPSSTNEILQLLDSAMVQQDLANYDDASPWPSGGNGPSIYLTNLASDNNDGSNWGQSSVGVDGAINPNGTTFSTSDIGSPGVVPAISADVIVTETGESTVVVEAGATDTFDVVLQGTPTSNVNVTVTPSNSEIDLGNGAGNPVVLVFTPMDAGTPITVTVTAVDDAAIEGPHSSEISFSVASADGDFNGLAIDPISVSIQDDDAAATTNALINEFVADHTGNDDFAFVEIYAPGVSTPTDLSGLTLLEIEGTASNRGRIDKVVPLGLTDADGYYVANIDAENDTVTFLLVSGFTGAVGDDIDTDDDGIVDATLWSAIIDSVATVDDEVNDFVYAGAPALVEGLDGVSFQYGGASRIPNGTDTDTTADWVRNAFNGAGFAGFPMAVAGAGEAINTPGAVNEVAASDSIAPTVLDVKIAGSSWSSSFLSAVDSADSQGFLLEGANQTRNLPWTNLNTLVVEFSEDIGDFTAADFTLAGVNVADYGATVSSVSYDPVSFTATITLSAPIGADKVLLQINDGVTDLAGNSLDGEWTDTVSTESGDGNEGGDFNFRFNVLPGDFDGSGFVLGSDLVGVRDKAFTFAGTPSFDPFADIDGNGVVLGSDLVLVRDRSFTSLPFVDPTPPASLTLASSSESTDSDEDSWNDSVDELFALIGEE